MQAVQILKSPLFFGKLVWKLRQHRGGRDVIYVLRDRLGLTSDTAIAVGKKLKILAAPVEARKRFAARATLPAPPADLATEGWMRLPKEQVTGAVELAQHCAEVFECRKEEVLANYTPPFTLVFKIDETIENPEELAPVVRFCAQPAIFDLVSSYVGEYPVLSSIALGYTKPNSSGVGSQLYHCDSNEPRQLHLIMPIWPIDMESGPFTFLPAPKSITVHKAIKHDRGRIPDDVMFSQVREDEMVYCTGNTGDVYLVNPYACFHCGARTRSKPRLILIINFTSLFQGPESRGALYLAANRQTLDDGSREGRLLLNLA